MANFPTAPGISTRVVDFGVYYDLTGASLLSSPWTVTVTISQEIRWTQTGDVIEQIAVTARPDTTGHAQIRMPIVDQAGWVDANGSAISGWSYTAHFAATGFAKRDKVFQVFAANPDPIDGDNYPDGSVAPPPIGGTTYVNSVTYNGVLQSGAVVITGGSGGGSGVAQDPVYSGLFLPGVGGGGGSGGPITVSQITDRGVAGGNVLLAADAAAVQGAAGLSGILTTVAAKADTATVNASLAAKADTTTVNTGLAAKVNSTLINAVSGVAPLDAGKLLPLINAPTVMAVIIGNGSATIPTRPATPNPVIFNCTSQPPMGGTVNGGSAAAVNGLDIWWG